MSINGNSPGQDMRSINFTPPVDLKTGPLPPERHVGASS
jgi:hypothetical protein